MSCWIELTPRFDCRLWKLAGYSCEEAGACRVVEVRSSLAACIAEAGLDYRYGSHVMADVMFVRDVSYQLRNLARKGAVPYRLRYPFFPFLAGFIAYGAISFGHVSTKLVPTVAVVAAAVIAASKL